jgi:hypothetical protein
MGMMDGRANMPLIATSGAPLTACQSYVPVFIQTGEVSGLESQFWKVTVSLWNGTAYQKQLHRPELLKMATVSRHVEKFLAKLWNTVVHYRIHKITSLVLILGQI